VTPSRFDTVIAVAFDRDDILPLLCLDQTNVVDPSDGCAIDGEEVGFIDSDTFASRWVTTRVTLTICTGIREQRGAPWIAGLWEARLPVAPAHECGTPLVTFTKVGVAQVFFDTLAVIVARSLTDADFGGGDFYDTVS
jgi:hypothetical protein